ncbi:nucleoside/nucleotide kinase family protein [Nostocoides sp. Soil756]|jgi:pantothenate kinase|uniref:nucleoside/nucleotide kinase family protein n=1 Tax=Nostocoides sp. Soil756 TaxID=1736399 RepID=UPI000701EE1D|nr:nucleoside/nucleotide kinase family protein [Tetrasphaera sp. Soil756]KRE60425.1 fructose transporter [Tetrasphaera sp. Soil756]
MNESGPSASIPSGLAPLADLAEGLVPSGGGRALLGVCGVPGAGKSTLAEALVAELARRHGPGFVAHVPMDGYHLADVQLERLGLRDRKGAPETFDALGYAALLRRLREDVERDVYAPDFERTLEQPIAGAMVVAGGARLVVTEGNYLLLDDPVWREARAALDAVWFVDGDDEVRRSRLVARHVAFGKTPEEAAAWVSAVDEPNAAMVRAGRGGADRVVLVADDGWRLPD